MPEKLLRAFLSSASETIQPGLINLGGSKFAHVKCGTWTESRPTLWIYMIDDWQGSEIGGKMGILVDSTGWLFHPLFPGRIGIWKCWFLWRKENLDYPEKNPRNRDENQRQTQPTHHAETGNRTRTTLVGGECSHHYSIPTRTWVFPSIQYSKSDSTRFYSYFFH